MLERKRIESACQQCKERKRRCDGGKPCCSYCLRYERSCIYTERRRRGPAKSKSPTKPIMQQHDQEKSSSGSDPAHFPENDGSGGPERVNGDTAQDSREGQSTPRESSMNHSNQSLQNANESTMALPAAAKRFIAFSEDIRMTARQMQIQIQTNKSHSEKKVFMHLPPEHLAVDLIRAAIEETQLHGVFLTKENAVIQLVEHYSIGLEDPCSNICRWATLCSFMGICALHKAANASVAALSSIAWAFFKNAFAMYAELAFQRPEISTCEALLAMALFMLRTADACVAARLTASAAQSILMLGLHKYEHYVSLETEIAERQRRIFWVTYIVNADVAHKYGLSTPLGEEDVDVEFPEHVSGHENSRDDTLRCQQADILRQRAILAVTQLRIHKLLRQVLCWNSRRNCSDLHETIRAVNEELETWKDSLPSSLQPGSEPRGSPLLEMPVAMLHYIYFSCVCKVSMAVVLSADPVTSKPVQEEQSAIDPDTSCYNIRFARARCAMAARRILGVLFRLQPQSFTHLWQTLCFPLSAVLILLSEVLTNPASVEAETDAQLIHDFVQYLERLQREGNDVRDALDGCNRFHTIATYALEVSRSAEQTNTFQQSVQIQLLQLRFAQVTDWLLLAQGLLSNMPAPQCTAREILCDILNPAAGQEKYGHFVPKFLKSSTYDFPSSS